MSKRIAVLIFICIILTVGFIYITVKGTQNEPRITTREETPALPETSNIPKTAFLQFAPQFVNIESENPTTQSVDIVLDSGGAQVSGAQIDLFFDPAAISTVRISPPDQSFFGEAANYSVLFNQVNQANGKISYAVSISPNGTPRTGSGKVVTISFTPNRNTDLLSTKLTFAPTTLVTTLGARQTILKEAIGLNIVFDSPLSVNSQ